MSDCCGSPVLIAPIIECAAAIGTVTPIADVAVSPVLFSGTVDASTLLTPTRPTFSPTGAEATAVLTRLSIAEVNHHPSFAQACFPPGLSRFGNDEINNPANWWRFIEVIAYSYEDWRFASQRAQYHWPKLQTGRFVQNTASTIPGTWAAVSDDTMYLFFSGSSNYQQLALQAAASFTGPGPCGSLNTSAFWCASFNVLWPRIFGYALPDRPKVICAGHSYGAVMASIFAARIKENTPAKDVSLITYGCPCPGDKTFSDRLWDIRAVHLVNRGDPVASIPPAGGQLNLLTLLLNPLQMNAWRGYVPLRNRTGVNEDGSYHFVSDIDAGLGVLQVLTEQLVAAEVPAPFEAHNQWTYVDRLRATAGLPPL